MLADRKTTRGTEKPAACLSRVMQGKPSVASMTCMQGTAAGKTQRCLHTQPVARLTGFLCLMTF